MASWSHGNVKESESNYLQPDCFRGREFCIPGAYEVIVPVSLARLVEIADKSWHAHSVSRKEKQARRAICHAPCDPKESPSNQVISSYPPILRPIAITVHGLLTARTFRRIWLQGRQDDVPYIIIQSLIWNGYQPFDSEFDPLPSPTTWSGVLGLPLRLHGWGPRNQISRG